MSKWSSWENVPLAECDRCKRTYAHRDLMRDPNQAGLLVCDDCCDDINPFKIIAKRKFNLNDEIRVRNPRPMAPLTPTNVDNGVDTVFDFNSSDFNSNDFYTGA